MESSGSTLVTEPVGCGVASEAASSLDLRDVDSLRAALTREMIERRRAECLATIQTNVVKYAIDTGLIAPGD